MNYLRSPEQKRQQKTADIERSQRMQRAKNPAPKVTLNP